MEEEAIFATYRPTNFTGLAKFDFGKRKKRIAALLCISRTARQDSLTKAFHSIGVHIVSAFILSSETRPYLTLIIARLSANVDSDLAPNRSRSGTILSWLLYTHNNVTIK